MSLEMAKASILTKLYEHANEYISGEMLGRELSISRAAVWKHIRNLRRDGYEIEASTKNGYRLAAGFDIINTEFIMSGLSDTVFNGGIIYTPEVDSTNTAASFMAQEGAPEGTVVIADNQTKGRGRMGRSWQSLPGKGIWMSFILRPELPVNEVQTVTLAASVSVAQALEKLTGVKPGIKWPNDIILESKKVCGILTEMNSEVDRVNYIIVGIGINFSQNEADFSAEISNTAVSLSMLMQKFGVKYKNIARNDIIKEVLSTFDEYYKIMRTSDKGRIISDWRKYSVTLGSRLRVHAGNGEYCGKALDINCDGALIIKADDGSIKNVSSGEVSIRGIMGSE